MGGGEVNLYTVWEDIALFVYLMLNLRAFKRALSSPTLFAFEMVVALMAIDALEEEEDFRRWWLHRHNIMGVLVFAQFLIHRARVLLNKVAYIGVSFLTAFKNKKQRIRN